MRLDSPRIEPLSPEDSRAVQLELFGQHQPTDKSVLNITGLWAKHPKLMAAQRDFQKYIFRDLSLSPRLRELAILRIGWLCKSGYELAQHAAIGINAGLDARDLELITQGPDSAGWTALESAVIQAVDEMFADAFISSETWAKLAEELDEQQLLDLMSIVGRYWCVSVVLNSTGIQLEEGTVDFSSQMSSGS